MEIQYIGEHIFPGTLGKILIVLAFVTSIVSTVTFFLFSRKNDGTNRSLEMTGRISFMLHTGFVIATAATLYYLIFHHYFEYQYVWQYSSLGMTPKFLASCFWAGQEGSFLLWAFWQSILGTFVLFRLQKKWMGPTMTMISLSQFFIISMVIGLKIGDLQIGSSPFVLIRDTVPNIQGTIFTAKDYLKFIHASQN